MSEKVNGFELDVTVANGVARVRVCLGEQSILETDALSCTGMEKLAGVLQRAAKIAAEGLDRYWYAKQQAIRRADAEPGSSKTGARIVR